jgi:hypothetical protein
MSTKELEYYESITKNYSQAIVIFNNQKKDDKDKLDKFLAQISMVFGYIDSFESNSVETLFTKQFDPANLAISVELIADASEEERYILRKYREILINRLNSYTKNRKLIYDLLVGYFMQFLNCYEQHSNVTIQIQRLMQLSALGFQTQASESYLSFLQGPLREALEKKQKELDKTLKGNDKSGGKGTAIR